MTSSRHRRVQVIVAVGTLSLAATGRTASATTPPPSPTDSVVAGAVQPSGPLCAALPAEGDGSLSAMATAPLATAISTNPLLTRLAAAVAATGLDDMLDQGPVTVLAPIDSAFDKVDPSTLDTLMSDGEALTAVLAYHVIPERLSSADLVAGGQFTTAGSGDTVSVSMVGQTLVINGGEAAVLCADVPTGNATVYLIDTVLTPPAPTEQAVETTAPAIETTVPSTETTEPAVETTTPISVTSEAVVGTTAQASASTEPGAGGGPIEFAEGSNEASVQGTTSNQSFDSWSVSGQTGQTLQVSVSAPDGNVTFDVFAPDGEVLADNQTSTSIELPADGSYAIELGTGANAADYTLDVSITG